MASATMTPPSTPMLMPAAADADDILDPPVPASLAALGPLPVAPPAPILPPLSPAWGEHEALLHGFLAHLQEKLHTFFLAEHTGMTKLLDAVMIGVRDWAQAGITAQGQTVATLGDVLTRLQAEGLPVLSPPYQAVLQAVTPAGFPVKLTVTKPSAAALIDDLTRLEGWLVAQHYVPLKAAALDNR